MFYLLTYLLTYLQTYLPAHRRCLCQMLLPAQTVTPSSKRLMMTPLNTHEHTFVMSRVDYCTSK